MDISSIGNMTADEIDEAIDEGLENAGVATIGGEIVRTIRNIDRPPKVTTEDTYARAGAYKQEGFDFDLRKLKFTAPSVGAAAEAGWENIEHRQV